MVKRGGKKDRHTYTVLQVTGNTAVITPAGRRKLSRMRVYTALDVRPGQRVRIGLATRRQTVLGFLCIALPLAGATAGCFGAVPLAVLLGLALSAAGMERFKAACALILCAASCVLIAIIARRGGGAYNTLQVIEIVE